MKIKIHRPLYLKYSLAFLFLDFVGHCYRRAVYSQGAANLLGIADYYPNILAGPIVIFLNLSLSLLKSEKEEIGSMRSWIEGLVIYEFLQLFPIFGHVFDWKDIFASLLGGGITLAIYRATNMGISSKCSDQDSAPL